MFGGGGGGGGGDCSPHGSYAPVHARRYLSIPCSRSVRLRGHNAFWCIYNLLSLLL